MRPENPFLSIFKSLFRILGRLLGLLFFMSIAHHWMMSNYDQIYLYEMMLIDLSGAVAYLVVLFLWRWASRKWAQRRQVTWLSGAEPG